MTIQVFTVGLSHVIKAYVSCMTSQINDTYAMLRNKPETLHSHCYNFNKYPLIFNENMKGPLSIPSVGNIEM
jgi:hypothetical protein